MTPQLKPGDKVEVMRQMGKNGKPHPATGIVESISNVIKVGGEQAAYIKYDDGGDVEGYWHPISKCKKLNK